MPFDRRSFIKGGGIALAGATLPGFRTAGQPDDPGCRPDEQTWEVPASTLPADPADNPIEHIGVLMMENRSYDSYFGWLEGGRGWQALGLDLSYTDPDSGEVGRPAHWAPEYRRCGHPDPAHGWDSGRGQLREGFLHGRNDEYALAYYLAEDIQIYTRLVRQFSLLDDYYCSQLSSTYPNRWYQHAATSMGLRSNVFPPEVGAPTGFDWPTIWDRLDAAGISWAYYHSDLPFTAMWGPRLLHNTRPIEQYYVDAATGNLPRVFFVEPKFLPPYQTDDHPGGSDVRAAQAYVNNIVHAFVNSSAWERGAFFINYDEWGGFFDHVTPPRVADERASEDLDEDHAQLGFRVPCLAISPYSRKGYVHHDGPYDHTSILRFIEYRYDLEPLTIRDAEANNIGEVFDYTQAPRTPKGLDAIETPTVYDTADCNYVPAPDDFARFAESGFVEQMGYTVHEPTLESLYGFGAAIEQGIAAAGGATSVPLSVRGG